MQGGCSLLRRYEWVRRVWPMKSLFKIVWSFLVCDWCKGEKCWSLGNTMAPYVKYSIYTHNTEQKSLKITENTLTSIWTLCAKLWVQFQDRDIIICFQRHTKNAIFQSETISVESNEHYAKQSRLQNCVQNVHRQRSNTLAVQYATDNHAVLIKWKASR